MTKPEKVAQPAVTNAILKRHGFHMRKGLGQNFLTDSKILQTKNCDSRRFDP